MSEEEAPQAPVESIKFKLSKWLLYSGFTLGVAGAWFPSMPVWMGVAAIAVSVVGIGLRFSSKHDDVVFALLDIYGRIDRIEKLAGIEYTKDDEGLPEMRFQGNDMSLIDLEQWAENVRAGRPGYDDEVNDADDV